MPFLLVRWLTQSAGIAFVPDCKNVGAAPTNGRNKDRNKEFPC